MKTRSAVAAFALLLAGCPSGPDPQNPPEIDLSKAQKLEADGRTLDAILEHARLVDELVNSGRNDARAHASWARILLALRRLKVGETLSRAPADARKKCASLEGWCSPAGPSFLSAGAAGRWTQVLSLGADPALLSEAATSIAVLLTEKLDDRSLRRGRLVPEGEVSERLYRRYLAEAASDYLRYALGRTPPKIQGEVARGVEMLRGLGRELRELAALPGVRPGAAARWAERATEADAQALALKSDHTGTAAPMSNDLRLAVELDTNGLLRAAVENHNKANDLLSRRADEEEILELLERCLRYFVTARECLVEPTALQKRTLDVKPIAADALRGLAFEK